MKIRIISLFIALSTITMPLFASPYDLNSLAEDMIRQKQAQYNQEEQERNQRELIRTIQERSNYYYGR